jgi:ROS/MUCR transcriptional regulator protein
MNNYDDVECLICRRKMRFLGAHIKRAHGVSAAEYRAEFDLPASTPLASASYCDQARKRTNERIKAGSMTYDHLPLAVDEARAAGRGYIASSIREQRSKLTETMRPGDKRRLPAGYKRADGRDADRARLTQQRRRQNQKKPKT